MSICLRGPAPTPSVKKLSPMPISSPRSRLLRLLLAQVVVAGHVQGQPQRARVVAGVVLPAGLRRVRELVGLDEVLHPQLGRVGAELLGEDVDHPLDEVDGLGDPERAGVGDPARRLVRVDAGDLAVRGPQVVAAGEDVEEPGRELRRLRGAVEGAVVGEHVDPYAEDRAVVRRRDGPGHVVVAGERGRHQVLAAVLDPLHRLAGHDRPHDGQDVARVDADLAAEPAADVRGDDLDLVLGDAGHQRVDGAVRVRCLVGRPDGELAGHRVHVGDRAAGLHRRGVHARVEHLLGDHDVRRGEHLVGEVLVAGLPVEDVVVRLALDVVADDRGALVERLLGVHDRRQRLVVDLDEVERVARGVLVLGDDEGDLLALEAHLVGGEHRLDVHRQRRHPREVQRLEGGTGDDRLHLRHRLGLGGVDRPDPGVRIGAAQDRGVQHAGQRHVVEVAATAADETYVLLALHPAEADRVAGLAGGDRVGCDGGHAFASCASPAAGAAARAVAVLGGPAHRAHDVLVAGAPAELPGDGLADGRLVGVRVVVEQPAGGHHHARACRTRTAGRARR